MLELLKQPQYQPMPVADQVAVIYAGTHGHVDDVEVEQVTDFAAQLVPFIRERHPGVLQAIADTGELGEQVERDLQTAIESFHKRFREEKSEQQPEGESP